jgi:hypothetical protein
LQKSSVKVEEADERIQYSKLKEKHPVILLKEYGI